MNNSVIGEQQGFTSFDPAAFSGTRFTFAGNYVAITRPHGLSCFGCTDSRFIDNVIVTLPQSDRLAGLHVPGGANNVFQNNVNMDLRGINAPLDQVLPSRLYSALVPSVAGMVGSQHDNRDWRISDEPALLSATGPVPEPGGWMMMLFGFVMVGRVLRGRQAARVVLS